MFVLKESYHELLVFQAYAPQISCCTHIQVRRIPARKPWIMLWQFGRTKTRAKTGPASSSQHKNNENGSSYILGPYMYSTVRVLICSDPGVKVMWLKGRPTLDSYPPNRRGERTRTTETECRSRSCYSFVNPCNVHMCSIRL